MQTQQFKEQDIRTEIGKRVTMLRIWRNMKQADVAKKLGVDQARISALERGHRNVPLSLLTNLCTLLRCDLNFFDIRYPPSCPE